MYICEFTYIYCRAQRVRYKRKNLSVALTKEKRRGTEMDIRAVGYGYWRSLVRDRWHELGRLGDQEFGSGPGAETGERCACQSPHTHLHRQIPGCLERARQAR